MPRSRTVDRSSADWSADPSRFSGRVGRQELARTAEGLGVLAVFFEAGSRTLPHVHVNDQVLVCLEGEGVVSTATDDGDPDVTTIRASDAFRVPGGTWHWHGARRSSPMTHLSILVQDDGDQWQGVEPMDWESYRGG